MYTYYYILNLITTHRDLDNLGYLICMLLSKSLGITIIRHAVDILEEVLTTMLQYLNYHILTINIFALCEFFKKNTGNDILF